MRRPVNTLAPSGTDWFTQSIAHALATSDLFARMTQLGPRSSFWRNGMKQIMPGVTRAQPWRSHLPTEAEVNLRNAKKSLPAK